MRFPAEMAEDADGWTKCKLCQVHFGSTAFQLTSVVLHVVLYEHLYSCYEHVIISQSQTLTVTDKVELLPFDMHAIVYQVFPACVQLSPHVSRLDGTY